MEKIKCYVCCYGGYVLAVGAGCMFDSNLWVGVGLLAAAGFWAYKQRCCANHSCTK